MTDRPGWSAPGRPPDDGAAGGGWGQPQWSAPETGGYGRPGVIPLRPLSIGEMLDGAVTAIRFNPRVMIGLSAVVAVVSQLLELAVTLALVDRLDYVYGDVLSDQSVLDSHELFSALGQTLVVVLLSALLTSGAVLILTGVLTVVVSRAVLGQRIDVSTAWRLVRPTLARLIGVTLLIGVGAGLAVALALLPALAGAATLTFLLLAVVVVGAVYAIVRLALVGAVVVLEHATVRTALQRSWALVATAWWRTFGVLVLTAVITQVVSGILSLPFGLLAGGSITDPTGGGTGGLFVASLGTIIGAAVTWPFAAAVTVLIYVDRRMRREGLDLELARAAGLAPGDNPA